MKSATVNLYVDAPNHRQDELSGNNNPISENGVHAQRVKSRVILLFLELQTKSWANMIFNSVKQLLLKQLFK